MAEDQSVVTDSGSHGVGDYAFGDANWPGLAKLNEECGEVIQVIGKMMMVHGGTNHWSGDLRIALKEEMADVLAAIQFLGEVCFDETERQEIARRRQMKTRKFQHWHRHPGEDQPPLATTPTTSENGK